MMAVKSTARVCIHTRTDDKMIDWRECFQCIDMMQTELVIARQYLKELAYGVFNDDGVMQEPVAEPVRGQGFARIAATGFGACGGEM